MSTLWLFKLTHYRRVATIKVEHFDTLDEARAAERVAIKSEKPMFNMKMNRG